MMLEIIKDEGGEYALSEDGVTINTNKVVVFPSMEDIREPDEPFEISIYDYELSCHLLEKCRLSDFPREVAKIEFIGLRYVPFPDKEIYQGVKVKIKDGRQFEISLTFDFAYTEWRQLWSTKDYTEEFYRIAENVKLPDISFIKAPNDADKLIAQIVVENAESTIDAEVTKQKQTLRELHKQVVTTLTTKVRSDSVVILFDFPDELKIPFEQYLLYFIQFLKDIGVEATASLQHEAGQVLFAVTPTNKDEALDKIYTALRAYLKLATSPISDSPATENEIAIQRLIANVDHLKSQLRLSHLMVRAQETTIQAQQTTIANQQRILSGEIILDSIKDVTPKPKDKNKEELIKDTLSLIPIQGKGFEVNLPELFRKLKRLFDKE